MPDERERWGGRVPFVMAAIGSAVGLGNVWRFPYVASKSGGGAFLVPYFIALITAGIPLMIVEYTLGQKFQKGAPGAMAAVNKKFRWVGWFALLVGSMISFYYVAIMGWAWHYGVASSTLEWTRPAPVRVEQPVGVEQKTIPPERVVLYLAYRESAGEDVEKLEAHKERLRRIVRSQTAWGTKVLLLSEKELRARRDAEKLKPENERKLYVSLDDNARNYFHEKCLGGFAVPQWKAYCAENAKLDKRIEARSGLKKDIAANKKLSSEQRERRTAALDKEIKDLKSRRISYLGDMFKLPWQTALWCGVTWLAIFLIIFKGVRIVGKVVMWTVSLPVVLLGVLLVRGLTLNGATEGIIYYLTPTWDMLTQSRVWLAAYGQIFFSLSLGFGILIAYASYKPKDSDVSNNAFITSFANCATSFFAGFAVFSVLGYLAVASNVPRVEDVLAPGRGAGPGLVFITYPIAIAKIGGVWARVIGVTFFLCLLLLGIDSAFSIVEGVITGIKDRFPGASKPLITAGFCLVGFCCTLFFATSSGMMWLDIVDHWMNSYGLAVVGLLECVAVAYFFRHHEIEEFVNERSEIKLGGWFELFIKYITPAILVFLLGKSFIDEMKAPYGGYDTVLPWSVDVAGWGVYVALVAIALALGRNWTKFLWLAAAGGVFLVFMAWLGKADVAAMAALGSVLLFGGFFTCLRIALKSQNLATAPPEQ